MGSSELPESPFSPAESIALEFKSVYDANISAGFTENQALYLLAVQMVGNPGIAPGSELPNPPQPG